MSEKRRAFLPDLWAGGRQPEIGKGVLPRSAWVCWIFLILSLNSLPSYAAASGQNKQIHNRQNEKIVWLKRHDPHFELYYTSLDSNLVLGFRDKLDTAYQSIEGFFQHPFKKPFKVYLFPNRNALDNQWRQDWNLPDFRSECWMVASGVAYRLDFLSPRVWTKEACEHKPDDPVEIQRLITHELVHVYHGQYNSVPDFEGLDDIGWFLEGLAVYVSGQLDRTRMRDAKEAIRRGKSPKKLKNAWSGRYRYAVSGSLVKFVDDQYGRDALFKLLSSTQQRQILSVLKTTEQNLLNSWKESLVGRGN